MSPCIPDVIQSTYARACSATPTGAMPTRSKPSSTARAVTRSVRFMQVFYTIRHGEERTKRRSNLRSAMGDYFAAAQLAVTPLGIVVKSFQPEGTPLTFYALRFTESP